MDPVSSSRSSSPLRGVDSSNASDRISHVARQALAIPTGGVDYVRPVGNISAASSFESLEKKFEALNRDYSLQSKEDCISDKATALQSAVLDFLSTKILSMSSTPSVGSDSQQANLEQAVISSIKVWKNNVDSPTSDPTLAECFADDRIGQLMCALCNTADTDEKLQNIAPILKDSMELVKECIFPSSVNTPRSGSRSSADLEGDKLATTKIAEGYRTQQRDTQLNLDNEITESGQPKDGNSKLLELFNKTSVVILGEGDHDEIALDAMIKDPSLPCALFEKGVKILVAEHIYPEHISNFAKVDCFSPEDNFILGCSEVATHLIRTAFGKERKAFIYLNFLRACSAVGIEVVAADTKEIYRPSGVNISTYNQTDRVDLLNKQILELHGQHIDKGKMLIIVGAAHSNSLNAEASRSQMPEVTKPRYKTPGVTDVISNAQEFIVVQNRTSTEASQVRSIKDGMVFKVEI